MHEIAILLPSVTSFRKNCDKRIPMLPLVYQKMNHDAQSMLCAICKIHIGIKVVFCFRHAALFIIIMGICSLASNTHDEASVKACLVYSVESVYIYNSSYYHRQIGSIILSHL